MNNIVGTSKEKFVIPGWMMEGMCHVFIHGFKVAFASTSLA